MAAPPSRARATLFDKLVSNLELTGLRADADTAAEARGEITREGLRFYTVPDIERFNENALRATVRRELAWLLNTVNLDAVQDLEPYPHVRTSVVNYGIPDLTGKAVTQWTVQQRARDIRDAVLAFEPRIDPKTLAVEPRGSVERDNAVSFDLRGDVVSAVNAMPVRFVTDVEVDTGAVTVRD
jgi:type VI secretion system protein ImpF